MTNREGRLKVLNEPALPEPWRSLVEGLDTTGQSGWDRRTFLGHLGASLALAGLAACDTRPAERIVPYVRKPEGVTPGVPNFYATSMVLGGYAMGLIVRSNEGRPTKVEGNEAHPASLGSAGIFEQASLLELYDPSRAAKIRGGHAVRSYKELTRAILQHDPTPSANPRGPYGAGLHFLLEPTSSPTRIDLIQRVRERYPEAAFHFFDPLASNAPLEAARVAYGTVLVPELALDRAAVVLDLDGNILDEGPQRLRYSRLFADGRRLRGGASSMNRLYVVESRPSPTGALADHRLAARSRDVFGLAAAITAAVLRRLGPGRVPGGVASALAALRSPEHGAFVEAVAADLVLEAGHGIIATGPRQPVEVHALVSLMNALLGNDGATVTHHAPALFEAGLPSHGLAPLASALAGGTVDRLLILGGNPVYTAPADLELRPKLRSARLVAHLGLFENETSEAAEWFVPAAHDLERWGDARAHDGTISFVQPLIQPIYGGLTPEEILGLFLGGERTPLEMLTSTWASSAPESERFRAGLERGFLPDTSLPVTRATLDARRFFPWLETALSSRTGRTPAHDLELAFFPDRRVHAGEFTNNPWLLELPDPLTKLTWGNAAVLSPVTAASLDVATGQWLAIGTAGQTLEAPVFVLPGQPDGSIAVTLGFGRSGHEALARGVGFNAYSVRTTKQPWSAPATAARLRGERGEAPVPTQTHWSLEGRPIALLASLAEYRRSPAMFTEHDEPTPTIRAGEAPSGTQWAMTIDLNVCHGCSACVVACQAENNVPVVGRENVARSREMHWLRIDRYFVGATEDPEIVMQPMACQHCERAPCEYVCPVNATVHSQDGLNDMVYNRCVGTRFCSNNCPYKVRRFNWFDFHEDDSLLVEMARNPEVTVRQRGVMEKCTYCVQRIRNAEINARAEGRPLLDGEVQTACAQACPTRAIVFGDKSDPIAAVTRLREDPRAYAVLRETGSEPRTRYLARIQNRHPTLEDRGKGHV